MLPSTQSIYHLRSLISQLDQQQQQQSHLSSLIPQPYEQQQTQLLPKFE